MSPINFSPNWAEWARVAKSLGGLTTAVGIGLGALTPVVAPLAAVVPALAPLAPMLAAVGLLVHGIGTGAKAMLESLESKGLINTGPK